jgi:hypothetical protein
MAFAARSNSSCNAPFYLLHIWVRHGQLGGCVVQDSINFENSGFHINFFRQRLN